MSDDDPYAFEKTPYGRLVFKVNRRKLFVDMLSGFQAAHDKADGKAVLKLADLGNCPDHEIACMVPAVVPNCRISLVDDRVYGQPPFASEPFELFPIDIPAVTVFNMFNGAMTIAEVSDRLSQETSWDTRRAFAYTRGVFLWLTLAGICMPTGF